jgi:hypothetical protein
MKRPNDLPKETLVEIVQAIIEALYLEIGECGELYLDPDKEWDADILDSIAGGLGEHDLIPDEIIPVPQHRTKPASDIPVKWVAADFDPDKRLPIHKKLADVRHSQSFETEELALVWRAKHEPKWNVFVVYPDGSLNWF